MKEGFRRAALIVSMSLATAAVSAGVQAATKCSAVIGFDSQATNPPTTADILPGTNAWQAVVLAGDHENFKVNAKNMLANCDVKVVLVTPKGSSTKSMLAAGPMGPDECSLYNYLSSIDSKLAARKTTEAQTAATALVAKVDDLGNSGKLFDNAQNPGLTNVKAAVQAVYACTFTP